MSAGTRVVERAVPNDEGRVVGVRRDNGYIAITWFCGDSRSFRPEDLLAVIEHVELLADHEDVWMESTDSNGESFFARIVGDHLTANTRASDGRAIPWKALKKAMKKAAKE